MNPPLHRCTCRTCPAVWIDYPGIWAILTRPQFPGDTTNGCPRCGGLYWDEVPETLASSPGVVR